jgi:hypothetical protein
MAAIQCEKNHISRRIFLVFADMAMARRGRPPNQEDAVMNAIFSGTPALAQRAHLVWALGLLLSLVTAGSALADIATPQQRRACTPDVYRLCAGEIPNVRAITSCLRRQKASLSEACRAVFEQ